jgi:hypothetical protein
MIARSAAVVVYGHIIVAIEGSAGGDDGVVYEKRRSSLLLWN